MSPICLSIICISKVSVTNQVSITFFETFLLAEELVTVEAKFHGLLSLFLDKIGGLREEQLRVITIYLENLVGQKGVLLMLGYAIVSKTV
jgi:hypothetical protein